MPLYFEDFVVDAVRETEARTVTESDIVQFCGISGDFNPLHTDAVFAASTPFGGRVAHGLLTLSIATGLTQRRGELHGTAIAFLSMEEWRFHAPVMPGDTIHVRETVLEKSGTSNPHRGVVKRRIEVVNQSDVVVQSGVWVTLIRRRPEADAGAAPD
ncbi:MAG: MaoC/PaaZ C-terminal domain-containing protein [Azospirillaceae bacterium]